LNAASPTFAWLILVLAGLFEIGFTTSMRYIDWSLKPWPIIAFIVFSTLSFGLLFAAVKTIPLGTAYAVWTGIGAAGTALLGIAYYGEPATTLRLLFLTLLIGSIMGLKAVSPH
jgi:quaternary ammonium compound-resistance protein SugE